MAKPQIFFISGLGADHRAFDRINIDGYEQIHLPWLIPDRKDTMHSYARRLAEPIIEAENPVVIGLSLGGMLASEMTTFVPHMKAILISSIKGGDERSLLLKAGRAFPVQHMLPVQLMKNLTFAWRWGHTKLDKEDLDQLVEMFHDQDNRFLKWAMINAPKWTGKGDASRITQIHGSKDRMFPIWRINDHHEIKDGSHMMVFTHAAEVSELLRQELKRIEGV